MPCQIKPMIRLNRKWVTVDGVQHFAVDGQISCDSSLNKLSWNTTDPKSVCPICRDKADIKMKVQQLSLF